MKLFIVKNKFILIFKKVKKKLINLKIQTKSATFFLLF